MKTKFRIVVFFPLWLIVCGATSQTEAQENDLSRIPAQTVTLISRSKQPDYGKTIFDFTLGVRGDFTPPNRRYAHDIRYGGITDNGDNHWFDLPTRGSRSKLKDLGEMKWDDVYHVPVLFAHPVPYDGPVSWSYNNGKVVEISPEGVNIRAVAGHMHVMHVKDDDSDFYVMFRVDSLEPEGECAISWKRVSLPEGN